MTVLVLLVVIVLAVVGVRALTTTDDAAAEQPKLDPSQVASITETPTPSASPSESPSASATAAASGTSSGAVVPCESSDLSVVLTSDATTYGPGKAPKLVITVQNTSEVACSAEIGSAVRTLTATDSAGTQVWSTADCQSSTASQVYPIEPGKSRSMSTTWSRLHSAAGCPDGQSAVDAGSYTVVATWDGITAEPLSLSLSS